MNAHVFTKRDKGDIIPNERVHLKKTILIAAIYRQQINLRQLQSLQRIGIYCVYRGGVNVPIR